MSAAGYSFFFSWEVELIEWLQDTISPAGIKLISHFSLFGEEVFLILILGFLYWGYDKRLGRTLGLTVLMGMAWSAMIKNVFLRRRPYFDNDDIKLIRPVNSKADYYDITAQGYSFPSMHSAGAVTIYGGAAVNKKKKWLIFTAVLLPILVGLSRIVVGVHYPTDVLGGWLIGIAAIAVVSVLEKRINNTLVLYGILLITLIPGLFYCKSSDYYTVAGLTVGFMAGTLLEEKYIRFENTDKLLRMVLRLIGGLGLYFLLNTLLKLPFSKDFLEGGSHAAMVVRFFRYTIISAVIFGVYPMVFRKEKNDESGKM